MRLKRLGAIKLIMSESVLVSLLLVFNYLLIAEAQAANQDFTALQSLQKLWPNTPPNWVGSDPCDGWDGIKCTNSRVTSIKLSNAGLRGQLSGDIGSLSELEILDLSNNKGLTGSLPKEIGNLKKLSNLILVGCGFTGSIPDEIGSLQQLVILSLNSNNFSGKIPPSIGNLSNLYWLDLTDNELDGPIPVSSGGTSGLDMLLNANHFHLGRNRLSGEIPPSLFSSGMTLIHVLFDSNQLTGSIPPTLGLVQTLQLVRFDSNSLNGSVPQNLSNLSKVAELYLSNNKLSGPLPNLSGMKELQYLDMSNNSFERSDFPSWFSTLKLLTTLKMESTQLSGQINVSFFSQLLQLKIMILKNNPLNGTLNIGTTHSSQLQLIDLQANFIDKFEPQEGLNFIVILKDNPICQETEVTKTMTYCSISQPTNSFTTPENSCPQTSCSASDQILSPSCKCAYPYTGTLIFRTPSSLYEGNRTDLENKLLQFFQDNKLPVDSVHLSVVTRNPFQDHDFSLQLQVFPSGQDHFNITGISSISLLLSNLTSDAYSFVADNYVHYEPGSSKKSSNTGIIAGAAVGGSVLLVLALLAGAYAFWQKKRAEKAIERSNPFGSWDPSVHQSSVPQVQGARHFSFEELQKYTKNFSQANVIGHGGYGKVYRGTLPNGQQVAIKRCQKESLQGGLQFKAEIEMLSRVHHKNLVGLVGFCFEQGEEILVYEYVQNGNLKDAISGKSGSRLDWIRRLKVALGAARGLAYLHEHADPPIIHRDIKSNNILLDGSLNAKVADFGLSKLLDCDKDHITTQVRGTLGYLDPEYYTSQQLTEKSDVYSFGVLMLELITARKPIEKGTYIVKIVRNTIDKTKDLYGLHEILDPTIGLGPTLSGFDKFVDVAMRCVEDSGTDRPAMSEVVKEIENMLQSAGLNPNAESGPSTSASFGEAVQGSSGHPYSNESFDSYGVLPLPNVEPK